MTAFRAPVSALLFAMLANGEPCLAGESHHHTGRFGMLHDPRFRQGVAILAPKAAHGEVGRILPLVATALPPVWQLAQWHSRFPFTNLTTATGTRLCASNAAKWFCLDHCETTRPVLTLGVDSRPEYNHNPRRSPAEPWVHLLLQQQIQGTPSLSQTVSLSLRFEARLDQAETFTPVNYSTALHAAQFQIRALLKASRTSQESVLWAQF